MRELVSQGLRYTNGRLEVLDQQALPGREIWVEINSPDDMIECIKKLKIRGAPALGLGAVLSLALYAEGGAEKTDLIEAARRLRASRPTAVNLMNYLDRLVLDKDPAALNAQTIAREAEEIFQEDRDLCDAIAANGRDLFQDGDGILTHCNTGGLATGGVGTALGVIRRAHEQGKQLHVFVDETRPLLQGGRLTAWELVKLGIPHTLICDNMAAMLMRSGRVQHCIVGADRIAANGDFANKIGTYGLAVNAHHHGIPFYTAAPHTTVDPECASGDGIPIEERAPEEVRGFVSAAGPVVQWGPAESPVYNPAFDITPADLVDRWILDTGCFNGDDVRSGALSKKKACRSELRIPRTRRRKPWTLEDGPRNALNGFW